MFKFLGTKKGFVLFGKYSKGFTLVELLIVIAIIGVLASYTAYSFAKSRPKARLAVVQSQMSSLHPYLVICENVGDDVDFTSTAPTPRSVGVIKVCSSANEVAVFEDLPANWIYTVSSVLGSYRACTAESNTWEVVCSETGCVTNSPVSCP